jgi:ABC-type thiamine transport system ATPase subunit
MFPANAYVIRPATGADEAALAHIATLDSQRPLAGSILIGEIDGTAAAAIARVVADPFQRTRNLTAHLRMRAGAVDAYERSPSLPQRLRAGVRTRTRPRPLAA